MANKKTVIDGSNNVSARQLKDFFRQIDEKLITGPILQNFLEKTKRTWKVWKTIVIGKYDYYWNVAPTLVKNGYVVDGSASKRILDRIYLSTKNPESVDLALVTIEDLGFNEDDYKTLIPYEDILKRALKLGLTYCLPEDAPALREQYVNQPHFEFIKVGMVPVMDISEASSSPCIFVLNGNCIHCDSVEMGVSMDAKFVFRICK